MHLFPMIPLQLGLRLSSYICLSVIVLAGLLAGRDVIAQDGPVKVRLKTTMGDIVLELDSQKAPVTVDNFVQYVRDGHYDGTIFHRVIRGFMVQGGGMTEDMKQKPTRQPIKNESDNGLLNKKYTVAMARTSAPDSATAQFFINSVDNGFLDRARAQDRVGYCVFGRVIEGERVVDQIEATPTGAQDVPRQPIVIIKAELVE
jgi:cyclophilin family peptidyl-prolyl cis-trans isomerase